MLHIEKIIGAVDLGGTKIAVSAVTTGGEIFTPIECATAEAGSSAVTKVMIPMDRFGCERVTALKLEPVEHFLPVV